MTVPVLIGLVWLVRYTRQGKAMRATAQDKDAAAMMGIDVNRTISFTFLIAGGLAGVGGVIFAFYATTISFNTGFTLGLFAFTAAVLGGIGNLPGAVLGALLIGLVQNFNEGLTWHTPGSKWTRVARVRDPDHHPRLPAAGPARRAHAGGELMTSSAWSGGPPAMWRRQSPLLRRTVLALSISAILLILAATGHIQRSKELALIVAVVLIAFLAKAIYAVSGSVSNASEWTTPGSAGNASPRSANVRCCLS